MMAFIASLDMHMYSKMPFSLKTIFFKCVRMINHIFHNDEVYLQYGRLCV